MKKILLCIIVFCLSSVVMAQDVLDGFGQLRLGMSKAQVRALDDIGKVKFKMPEEGTVDEKIGTTELLVSKYTPIEGYVLKDLKLYFLNDSLYSIYVSKKTNLLEAITIKYGEPKKTKKSVYHTSWTEERTRKGPYGDEIEKIEKTVYLDVYTWNWKTNHEDIICEAMHSHIEYKPKSRRRYRLTLENIKTGERVSQLVRERWQKVKEEEAAAARRKKIEQEEERERKKELFKDL